MINDDIGERFKAVENDWRATLPSNVFTVIRVDGRAFHTWTRGSDKPFDPRISQAMDDAAVALCQDIPGALCAYVQSDEASIVASDLGTANAQHWFGGVTQKIASVSASVATCAFNQSHPEAFARPAMFDARVFPLSTVGDVADYLWWRQSDARRNAVSMMAHHHLGKKAIMHVGTADRIEMLTAAGVTMNDCELGDQNGRLVAPESRTEPVTFTHRRTGETSTTDVTRRYWVPRPADLIRNWFYDTHIERFGERVDV